MRDDNLTWNILEHDRKVSPVKTAGHVKIKYVFLLYVTTFFNILSFYEKLKKKPGFVSFPKSELSTFFYLHNFCN